MSWPLVDLEKVAYVNPRLPKDTDETQKVSFLGMASVSEQGQILEQETRVLSETKKGFTYFERNDVLLAKITPCFENGKAAYIDKLEYQIGYGSTEFHVLRAVPELLDPKYLFYLIWNDHFRFVGKHSMKGAAGQKRVSADFLKNFKIPIPFPEEPEKSLVEQKRIAAILDKADAIRRKRNEAVQLADDFLRSTFLDMFGDPESQGWAKTTVEQVAEDKKGSMRTGPFGSQLLHSEFVDDGIAVLGIDNAVKNKFEWAKQRFISEEKYKQLARYTVKANDVMITIMGTCGRCAIVPKNVPVAINTKHICCITLDKDKCLSSFLHSYFLYHPDSRKYLTTNTKGAIMAGLNMGIIKSMPVPIVPLPLQIQYDLIVENLSELTAKLLNQKNGGDLCFNSLSQKAFAGEL